MCNANKDAFHKHNTDQLKPQWATKELHVALSISNADDSGANGGLPFLIKPAERTYGNKPRGSAGHKFDLFIPRSHQFYLKPKSPGIRKHFCFDKGLTDRGSGNTEKHTTSILVCGILLCKKIKVKSKTASS